ncbi:MAG: hypothetical protein NTZ05_13990 [Chloroflexi bacterium]|nr:hypothetical protein [Chloroflexota bacterium]
MNKAWALSLLLSAGMFGSVVTASAAPAPVAGSFDGGGITGSAPASATAPAMVKVITSGTAGTMLADGDSRSLYLWTRDERNKSNVLLPQRRCDGRCQGSGRQQRLVRGVAAGWPPAELRHH